MDFAIANGHSNRYYALPLRISRWNSFLLMNADSVKTVSAAGLLVTLGIIFGDMGTSPLYVLSAIVGTRILPPKHARFATSDWV